MHCRYKQLINSEKSKLTRVKTNINLRFYDTVQKHYRYLPNVITCKMIYDIFLEQIVEKTVMEHYWLRECQMTNYVKLFENVWLFLKHVKNRKAANFKFKLLHHILPCQKMLRRWEKSDTDKCLLCNVVEDYRHLFVECLRVSNVLTDLIKCTCIAQI